LTRIPINRTLREQLWRNYTEIVTKYNVIIAGKKAKMHVSTMISTQFRCRKLASLCRKVKRL
jgi:hypothetical protein